MRDAPLTPVSANAPLQLRGNGPRPAGKRIRAPHVAELVADALRQRILDGQLSDGAELPKQEELLGEFGVSRPSVREALRILEAEGLVSVRRGKTGGAVVHRPKSENVAYALGLVLRSSSVTVDDVSSALNVIEPICAALCASRADRATAVVPKLRMLQAEAAQSIDDPESFTTLSRQFHEALVQGCGNMSLIVIVGALESVWSGHAEAWAEQHIEQDEFPDRDYRQRGFDDHEMLIRLIERGETDAVEREARRHLEWVPVYSVNEDLKVASPNPQR